MNKPTFTTIIEGLLLTYALLKAHGCTHPQAVRILAYCLQDWCSLKEIT